MVTQKEIFYQYLLNERDRLEADVISLKQNLRYKTIDTVDCLEYMLALERYNSFCNYFAHAIAIFKLSCPADVSANMVRIDYSAYEQLAKEFRKFQKRESHTN